MNINLCHESNKSLLTVCSQLDHFESSFQSMKQTLTNIKDNIKNSRKLRHSLLEMDVDPNIIVISDSDDDEEDIATQLTFQSIDNTKLRIADVQRNIFDIKQLTYEVINNISHIPITNTEILIPDNNIIEIDTTSEINKNQSTARIRVRPIEELLKSVDN